MTFQAKLVDPNGKQKAVVGTHDRVASGKEFQFFQHILGIMALGCVPEDPIHGFDKAGHQLMRLLTPDEIVDRAENLIQKAMRTAELNGWTVETVSIDEIYEDADGDKQPTGFAASFKAADLDDDIPF